MFKHVAFVSAMCVVAKVAQPWLIHHFPPPLFFFITVSKLDFHLGPIRQTDCSSFPPFSSLVQKKKSWETNALTGYAISQKNKKKSERKEKDKRKEKREGKVCVCAMCMGARLFPGPRDRLHLHADVITHEKTKKKETEKKPLNTGRTLSLNVVSLPAPCETSPAGLSFGRE